MSAATVAMNRPATLRKLSSRHVASRRASPVPLSLSSDTGASCWPQSSSPAPLPRALCMHLLAGPPPVSALAPPPHLQRRTPGAALSARGAARLQAPGCRDTRSRWRRGSPAAAMASTSLARLQQNLNLAGIRLFLSVALVRSCCCQDERSSTGRWAHKRVGTHSPRCLPQGGRASLAVPQLQVPDISCVDWAALRTAGFTGVVFDKARPPCPLSTFPLRHLSSLSASRAEQRSACV